MGDVLFLLWLVGIPTAWVPVLRAFHRIMGTTWDDAFDRVMLTVLSLLMSVFWPVLLLAVLVNKVAFPLEGPEDHREP